MISITLDNDTNNLPRIAEFIRLLWDAESKRITLKTIYGVYQNDSYTYGIKTLDMVADNSTWVDARTGETLPEYAEGAVAEYDFFMAMISAAPVDLPALIQSYMNRAKQQGRYI